MLVKFRKVEEFLRDGLGAIGPRAPSPLGLIHGAQMRYLLLGHLQLTRQVLDAVVLFLVLTADDSDELAVWTPEYYGRALVLVRE